jgi:hypothetical protein
MPPVSESFGMAKMQPVRPLSNAIDKRRHTHNICERKRREHIKEGFEELQKRLPKKSSTFKMSKLDVLKTSIAYISDLASLTDSLESEVCQHLTRYAKMLGQSGNPLGPKISEEELESLVSDLDPARLLAFGKDMGLVEGSMVKGSMSHASSSSSMTSAPSSPRQLLLASEAIARAQSTPSPHKSQNSLKNLID